MTGAGACQRGRSSGPDAGQWEARARAPRSTGVCTPCASAGSHSAVWVGEGPPWAGTGVWAVPLCLPTWSARLLDTAAQPGPALALPPPLLLDRQAEDPQWRPLLGALLGHLRQGSQRGSRGLEKAARPPPVRSRGRLCPLLGRPPQGGGDQGRVPGTHARPGQCWCWAWGGGPP